MSISNFKCLLLVIGVCSSLLSCKKSPDNGPETSISNFSPSSGSYYTLVAVEGAGFNTSRANNRVTINGMGAEVQMASPTELKVEIPFGAGSGPISVQVAGKPVVTSTDIFHYLYTGTVSTFIQPAYFTAPRGLAFDVQGNLFVTNHGGSALIRKVSATGTVSTVAGSGTFGYVDGPAPTAQFSNLAGVAVDAQGIIYVADWGNHCIRKITSAGMVSTLAGNGAAGYVDGTGAAARFNQPEGLAIDAQGNVLVADSRNNRIRKITPTGVVSTLAGSGTQGGFADGPVAQARFYWPHGVAIDALGTVYVADTGNNRIRKISSAEIVTTVAGTAQCGGTDGPAGTATFNYPTGLAVNSQGTICVAEANGYRIRLLDPSGFASTLAGTGNACSSGAAGGYVDGPGSAAQFNNPYGVVFGPTGGVYVADQDNDCIRKIVLD